VSSSVKFKGKVHFFFKLFLLKSKFLAFFFHWKKMFKYVILGLKDEF